MKREILFRGKIQGIIDWVYGFYAKSGEMHCILFDTESEDNYSLVDESTVGQYTGLHDMNGKKIFEGDIVKYAERLWRIAWSTSNFTYMCVEENGDYWEWLSNMDKIEVIGNIHDNPELLTEKE